MPTPSITDRTGTAVRPRPGSTASRNPATPAGDMPAPCAAVTSFDGRIGRWCSVDRWGAARHAVSPTTVPRIAMNTERAETEHGPVDVEAARDLDRAHLADRHERRGGDGEHDRDDGADEHRRHRAGARGHARRAGRGTHGPEHRAFLGLGAQLTAEREPDEHEAREERDGTEQRERDGERPHRLLGVERGDRRDAEELRAARVEEAHVALLERVDVGVAALQHEPLPLVLHVGERLSGVRGREEDQRRAIGVVLHHFFREQPDADDGRGHAELRAESGSRRSPR